MSNIIKSSVVISFETDSGYSSTETIGPRPGSICLRSALHAIIQALRTNGEGELVRMVVDEAFQNKD
jgi:hypothetical protein